MAVHVFWIEGAESIAMKSATVHSNTVALN